MAKSASVSAQIDTDLKERAEQILAKLELTASQAIALFYEQIISKQGIPFEVTPPKEKNGANGHNASYVTEQSVKESERAVVKPEPGSRGYIGSEHAAILKEREAYEAMHSEIWMQYPNQYVSVYQGKVVDHDTDKMALIVRRRERYPGKSVLITQVEETPEGKTLYIRSPRLIR